MVKMKAQTKHQSQRQAFIDAARKAECNESEATFEGKLRLIAKAKPSKAKRKK